MNANLIESAERPALKSLAQFAREVDRTSVTIWRWKSLGWIDPADIVNLAGKPYITAAGIDKFVRRAQAGEFAKPHHAPKRNLRVAVNAQPT